MGIRGSRLVAQYRSLEDMQAMLDGFVAASEAFSLSINISKSVGALTACPWHFPEGLPGGP